MSDNKIAIIGFAGAFPGAENIQQFWDLLVQGKEGLERYERDEIDMSHLNSGVVDARNYVPVGGSPEAAPFFDAAFFGISPDEAQQMDPQHRKFLECAWHAFEHAGYDPLNLNVPVGVFAGAGLNSYLLLNLIDSGNWDKEAPETAIYGCGYDYLCTRLSYQLNLSGPSLSLQTGCSTSLVSIHLAIESLLTYQCDMALAGGVSLTPPLKAGYLATTTGMISPTGTCRPFDKEADGTVFTHGYATVILKRLEDALCDRDTVYAVISGSAINNDGSNKVSYMAPSVEGQKAVIRAALDFAGVSSDRIGFVECHGTATAMGDPLELEALNAAFGIKGGNHCAIGSLKGNFGHLNAASGIAGLLKAALCLHHKKLVPTLHYKEASERIDFASTPFYVNTESKPWKSEEEPRYAAVSSFGIGGTNAHVILQEAPAEEKRAQLLETYFLPLSAKSSESLERLKEAYLEMLGGLEDSLTNVSFTAASGRSQFDYRLWACGRSKEELIADLISKSPQKVILQAEMMEVCVGRDLEEVAKAWMDGKCLDWDPYFTTSGCRRIPLPLYPFCREKYWVDSGYNRRGFDALNEKNPNIDEWFYTVGWKAKEHPLTQNVDFSQKKALIIGTGSPCEIELSTHLEKRGCAASFCSWDAIDEIRELPDYILHCEGLQKGSESGLFSAVKLAQILNQLKGEKRVHIAFLLTQLANVSGRDPLTPDKATIHGASKVIPKEYPHLRTITIDVEEELESRQIDLLLLDLFYCQDEEVSYRGPQRWVRDYRKVAMPSVENFSINPGGYLITGGLGHFGLDMAEFLARYQTDLDLFLVSRRPFPKVAEWDVVVKQLGPAHAISKKIDRLKQLTERGVRIHTLVADVADRKILEGTIDSIQKTSSLKGVIHAAGVVESSILDRKEPSSFQTLFDAKVEGTKHIVSLTKGYSLDFCLLCSSMNALIGGLGQADNTAANAFVDLYAQWCWDQGLTYVFSLNWGAVNQSRPRDFVSLPEFQDLSREHVKNRMTDEEREEVFKRLFAMRGSLPRVVVSTIEMNHVISHWNRVADFDHLTKERNIKAKARSTVSQLQEIAMIEPETEYERALAAFWEEILGITPIGVEDNFFMLGGHSLSAIRMNNKIKERFGISLHAMSVYEYPLLKELASFVQEQVQNLTYKVNS